MIERNLRNNKFRTLVTIDRPVELFFDMNFVLASCWRVEAVCRFSFFYRTENPIRLVWDETSFGCKNSKPRFADESTATISRIVPYVLELRDKRNREFSIRSWKSETPREGIVHSKIERDRPANASDSRRV